MGRDRSRIGRLHRVARRRATDRQSHLSQHQRRYHPNDATVGSAGARGQPFDRPPSAGVGADSQGRRADGSARFDLLFVASIRTGVAVNADEARELYDYSQWAYRQVWTCIEGLSDEQFTRETDYSYGSLRNHFV